MAENNFISINNLYINVDDISLIEKVLDNNNELIGLRMFIKGINKYINVAIKDLSTDLKSFISIADDLKKLIPDNDI